MPSKSKRPTIWDTLMERVRELLDQLGPLLKPGQLQPIPVPTRERQRRKQPGPSR